MNFYKIEFEGRFKTANITYSMTAYREAESEETAILALRDVYDHVQKPVVTREEPKQCGN